MSSKYGNTDFTAPVRERSALDVALDNIIRRRLRVSDPSNAHDVALALQNTYTAEREAMRREAAGLPFVPLPPIAAAPVVATSSNAEVEQARTDVDRDLDALTGNALLKDILPELRGWGIAIRNAIADGINAARFALDPYQRDRAFSARRVLGDYARIARYVGALTPTMSLPYRRLAQSLDEVAAVLLVLMGEALADIGFSGGRFLLQVPASDLQVRRDAVLNALRNLVGSTQQAYAPNEWPRGLLAYSQFLNRLETSGQADLKALFQESYLARLLDDLIDRASSTNADGLRALGSTAQLGVDSFRRLILTAQRVVTPESPTLAAFLTALQLFIDPFDASNFSRGSRLLFISRPPIVFYGLYGIGGPDVGTQRLIGLTNIRGQIAERLDCYLGCDCTEDRVCCQIMLDKILYDTDRAIDLYTLGTDAGGDGDPEWRAAAYGYVISELLTPQGGPVLCPPLPPDLTDPLGQILDLLWYRDFQLPDRLSDGFHTQYEIQQLPQPQRLRRREWYLSLGQFDRVYRQAIEAIQSGTQSQFVRRISIVNQRNRRISENQVNVPRDVTTVRDMVELMRQELCLQIDAEGQWEMLLQTMAPSCIRCNDRLLPAQDLLRNALRIISFEDCLRPNITIPPHIETSLDSIADDINRTGDGRPTRA